MNDLTRWNRSGLTGFRYVDGNAATFLEDLRLALISRYTGEGDGKSDNWQWWRQLFADLPEDPTERAALDALLSGYKSKLQWTDLWVDVPARPETAEKREERLLALYRGERRDFAWEIKRALARALHVLTEHIDAYANEGYLGTATQWDNVRRLVEMLDYHPAPPASAETWLAIEAKDEGTLEEGFQVKYAPPEGGSPIFFETLADTEVDPDLNELRAEKWNQSPTLITGTTIDLEGKLEDPAVGDPILLERTGFSPLAYVVQGLTPGEEKTTVTLPHALTSRHRVVEGRTWANLEPKDRLTLTGPLATTPFNAKQLVLKTKPADLKPNTVLYIEDGTNEQFRTVKSVDGYNLSFARNLSTLDITRGKVSRARIESNLTWLDDGRVKVPGDLTSLRGLAVAAMHRDGIREGTITAAVYVPVSTSARDSGGYTTLTITATNSLQNLSRLYLPTATHEWEVDAYLELDRFNKPPLTIQTSAPKKLSAGDFVVLKTGSEMAWGKVRSVSIGDDDIADITVNSWNQDSFGPWYTVQSTVLGHYKTRVRPYGWEDNSTPLTSPVPIYNDLVKPGMQFILEGPGTPFLVTVTDTSEKYGMYFSPTPDSDAGYTYYNSLFRGNLVKAGHGKSKPEKVLGSGDAATANQSFLFAEKDVSFQSDTTFSAGVKAAVKLRVGDRTWVQVANLRDSEAADPHYSVAMTEDGSLKISFGDGVTGRRLPTGVNNIRLAYRVGSGLAGNLDAGSLIKPVKPHWLVEKVRQPMDASGGGEMEPVENLRENAPSTVLTLDRAVSLNDFAALLEGRSNIWQARAFQLPTPRGSGETIEIVVVPAGGGLMGESETELKEYVTAHAVPGVKVQLKDFRTTRFTLDITAAIQTDQFDAEKTTEAVRTAVLDAFSLQNRKLGQPVYLSEVYHVVEGITGVENSHCILNNDASLEKITPPETHVAWLHSGLLLVSHKEFQL
ncbi:MAG: hypothetical protein QNK37_09370 [Acidobacteriota bacterium]|nr:hypothetical protein [Acidobacteriota bacterium]